MDRQRDIDIAQYLFGWSQFEEVDGILYGYDPSVDRRLVVPDYSANTDLILDKVPRYRLEKKGGRLISATLWVDDTTVFSGRGFTKEDAIISCLMIWINRRIKQCRDEGCMNPEHSH